MKFELTEKKITAIILILALIVLILPSVLRWGQGNITLMGEEAYHHLKLAEDANWLFQAKFFTLYDLLLFSLNQIIESIAWSVILPILFGLGTVLLFSNLLKKFHLSPEQKFFILLLLILSPAFIYFFTFSNQYSLTVFLLILTATIFEAKNNLKYLAVPLILGLAFFDLLTTLITLAFLSVYWLLKKDKTLLYFAAGFLLIAVLIQVVYPRPWIYALSATNIFVEFFADLGSLKGVSLFSLLLTIVGLSATWKERRIYYFAYPAIVILLLLFVLVNTQVIVYLNFILTFFAGLGLVWLWERSWRLNFLKILSIVLLLAGISLAAVAQINTSSNLPPNLLIEESLDWLKENSRPDEVVFSHPSKGFWIEAMAERPVFLDANDGRNEAKLNITQTIFYSRDLTLTTELLEQNGIKYIWIDAEMQKGQVWDEDEEGLLFLFRNPRFRNIYNKHGIEIWRFG